MVHGISVSSTHSGKGGGGQSRVLTYEGGVCVVGVTRCVV